MPPVTSVAVRIGSELLPLDQALLQRLLRHDPETGALYWRQRTTDLFTTVSRNAADVCASWNTKYAGKPAIANVDPYGYLYGPIFKTKVKAHRVIFCMVYGRWPEIVDHIDGVRSNNRLENLREVSVAENNKNLALRTDNRFGHHGVYWDVHRGQWRVHAKSRFVGRYDTFEEAVAARSAAEITLGFHPNHGRA